MLLTIFTYAEHDSKEFPLVWCTAFSQIALTITFPSDTEEAMLNLARISTRTRLINNFCLCCYSNLLLVYQ